MLSDRLNRIGDVYVRLLGRCVAMVERHAWLVLTVVLALTVAGGWFAVTHFSVNTNMSALLSKKLKFQRERQAFVNAFPQLSDTIVAVVDGQTPGLADEGAERLAKWAREDKADYQSVYQPQSNAFFRRNALLYLSPSQLHQLSNRLARAQPLIASLSNNPTLPGLFSLLDQALHKQAQGDQALPGLDSTLKEIAGSVQATAQGRFRAVNWQALMSGGNSLLQSKRRFVIIKPHFNYHDIQPAAIPIAHLRAAEKKLGLTAAHGMRVRLTGSAVLDNDQLKAVSNGMGLSAGLSLALVLVLLIVGLRSWRYVAASLITLIVGLVLTTAFGLLVAGSFNLISIAFAVLFIGMGVDFSIQFCMRHKELTHTQRETTFGRTALSIGGALTLAATAAAASFYSVVPTSYAGIIDLGLISGTSMFIALLTSFFVLPALLTLFGGGQGQKPPPRFHPFSRIELHRYGRSITLAATVAGIATLPLVVGVHFDFNPLNLQNAHSEAVETLHDLMRSSNFSPYSMDILEPDLSAARKAAHRLGKVKSVSQAVTLQSYIPSGQGQKLPIIQDMALVIPPFSLLPPSPLPHPSASKLASAMQHLRATLQSLGHKLPAAVTLKNALADFHHKYGTQPAALDRLQDRLIAALPNQLQSLRMSLQAQRVTRSSLPKSLVSRYMTPDGRARVEVYSSLNLNNNANMRRFVRQVHGVAPGATGTPALLVAGGDAVVHAFIQATITAAVLIALLLWFVLRRWVDVFLVLSTLPLAALLTAATMRLVGLSFNLANIIVLPLLIGLGVAYGIYFVLRWREGVDLDQVMRSSTPEAVLFSALTTMASFGSLAVAHSPSMSALGETLSIALGYVLLTSLVVLPALLTVIPHIPFARNGRGKS